jgi:hypothetical protein
MSLEKPRAPRTGLNQSGWVTFDGGFAARPCTVIDRSADGAKIIVDDPSTVQQPFRLALTRDARTGVNCKIAWRRGKTIGITFIR